MSNRKTNECMHV